MRTWSWRPGTARFSVSVSDMVNAPLKSPNFPHFLKFLPPKIPPVERFDASLECSR
jgi:hypothetical protein